MHPSVDSESPIFCGDNTVITVGPVKGDDKSGLLRQGPHQCIV